MGRTELLLAGATGARTSLSNQLRFTSISPMGPGGHAKDIDDMC